jgi:hypothetical protein
VRDAGDAVLPLTYPAATMVLLDERVEYEAWLLEAIYEITDEPVAVKDVDELVYPADGGPPVHTIYAIVHQRIGDWRPGFLDAGAPLVFVTGFKLLDMLLEWVLEQNGKTSTFRFDQKIAALKGPVVFPPLIESRAWLRERLVALYEHLAPLRSTVVHAPHFTSSKGTLQVSSSKRGVVGPSVPVSRADLESLAFVLVSLLHYVRGSWTMDLFREKRIRHALDGLAPLHKMPPLRQLRPAVLNVRVYVADANPIEVDLNRIRADVQAKRPGEDVMFDLRLVTVDRDAGSAEAYLVPWDDLQLAVLRRSREDLARCAVSVPKDVDAAASGRAMNSAP